MNKHALWGSLALASTLAITGCNDSSNDDANSSANNKEPSGGATVNFTLLQTTDIHHHAENYSRLATKINAIRAEKADDQEEQSKNVILVDSGDFIMGTVYDMTLTSTTKTPAAFQFIQNAGYDVVTLGNHEFDYGDEALARMLKTSSSNGFNTPIVATNLVATGSPTIQSQVNGETIRQTYTQTLFEGTDQELKVGFIGLMGPKSVTTITNAPNINFNNDIQAIQAQVDELRQNSDLIVALSHSGIDNPDINAPEGDDVEYAKKINGIDIIASGHAHHRINETIVIAKTGQPDTYIFGGGAYGDFLSQLDITFKKGQGITGLKLVPILSIAI